MIHGSDGEGVVGALFDQFLRRKRKIEKLEVLGWF